MPQCEVCGNDYDKSFEVVMAGQRHVFDSFECAAHAWRRVVHTAIAKSLAMAWKRMGRCFAAPVGAAIWASTGSRIGPDTMRSSAARSMIQASDKHERSSPEALSQSRRDKSAFRHLLAVLDLTSLHRHASHTMGGMSPGH